MAERISDDVDVIDVDVDAAAPGETDPGIVDQLSGMACEADLKTISIAVEAFWALEGRAPADEDELVSKGLMRSVSPAYDITPAGDIVPAAASPCT